MKILLQLQEVKSLVKAGLAVSWSMGHQYRHGHMFENMSGNFTEIRRTESCLGIGTHHQEVAPFDRGAVQQDIADGYVGRGCQFSLGLYIMVCPDGSRVSLLRLWTGPLDLQSGC